MSVAWKSKSGKGGLVAGLGMALGLAGVLAELF